MKFSTPTFISCIMFGHNIINKNKGMIMANSEHVSFSSEQLLSKVLEMKIGVENKIQELENMKKQSQGIIDSQTEFLKKHQSKYTKLYYNTS